MKKILTQLIISFAILTVGIFIEFPIEFLNKPTLIVIEHIVFIGALTMIFLNYKVGHKIKNPFNLVSHFINSFFLLLVGYLFLLRILYDFSGYYPIWTDKKIYINQEDTTYVVVGQEYRISGSIISWRERKVKNILQGIRWTTPTTTESLNGMWRVIFKGDEFDFPFDTVANLRNGKIHPTNDYH